MEEWSSMWAGVPAVVWLTIPPLVLVPAFPALVHHPATKYWHCQGRTPHIELMGGMLPFSSFSGWICWKSSLIWNQRNQMGLPDWLVFLCPVKAGQWTPFGGSQAVRFYTFTRVLTVHQQNLNQIFNINGTLSDRYECCSKRYICLSKTTVTHRHVTTTILSVHT